MVWKVRRVVTGHDARGRSVLLRDGHARNVKEMASMPGLGLTDLCLFTDARYARHPSLADRHSPFQDYPLALEHFPSGSLISPPAHLTATHGGVVPVSPGSGGEMRPRQSGWHVPR